MGTVIKMRIDAFSDCTFKSKAGSYDAMINPDTIKLDRSIEYTTEQAPARFRITFWTRCHNF
jgi:hypothetical protein